MYQCMCVRVRAIAHTMEAGGSQKVSPLTRELTRVFGNHNKHAVLLKRNLKETEGFFREMRHNYSNARSSASTTASLEAGEDT